MLRLAVAVAALFATARAQSPRDVFDCEMRELAVEYAAFLQPLRNAQVFNDIADALDGTPEKAPGCNVRAGAALRAAVVGAEAVTSRFPFLHRAAKLPSTGGMTFYVATTGSDANVGTMAAPFATLAAAVAATRATPGYDTIILRGGTYFGVPTTVLGAADAGLTIQNFPGEEVWLSGAKPLVGVTWLPYNVNSTTPPAPPPPSWHVVPATNSINGNGNGHYVKTVDTWQDCEALCQNATAPTCSVWTWHDSNVGPPYTHECYFDASWAPVGEADHFSGYFGSPPPKLSPNVWSASLAGTGLSTVPGLLLNGVRMTRARFPNNPSPERLGFMPPFVLRADSWTPQQLKRAPDVQVDLPASELLRNTSISAFQTYTSGVGGTCDRFQPDAGYWCSNSVQGGGSVIYYVPIAMQATTTTLPNSPYANAVGGVVQTWRPGHWASWMYEIGSASYDASSNTSNFTFSRGGFQGSRGEDQGEDSFVENIFEELDWPTEWFFNETTQTLYFWNNATAGVPPPADASIVVPQTKHLFNITGTMANPVRDISILGLGMRDTAYTYMDPHSLPSGGDWSLERSAVVFVEGAERVTISGCVFERVDGNAILLSAYNRNATISYNEFAWIGSSAVALWGNTEASSGADSIMPEGYGSDGTSGNQPRFSNIVQNLCHELGILEKQSSFYTQFKAAQNTISSNIVYNGPRAHLNNNDGFGGGQLIERNLLLNSCRESGDHGPFNSWDRDPYLFIDPATGQATTVKLYDEIAHNFIVANYNSLGAVDNDDGSSYYYTHANFFSYGGGGLKNDFQGHDNIWRGNVIAYIDQYCLHNGYGGNLDPVLEGHEQELTGNLCILNNDGEYALPICKSPGKSIMANNTLYSPTGALSECGVPLAQWQAGGNDPGTTASAYGADLPAFTIAWARKNIFGRG